MIRKKITRTDSTVARKRNFMPAEKKVEKEVDMEDYSILIVDSIKEEGRYGAKICFVQIEEGKNTYRLTLEPYDLNNKDNVYDNIYLWLKKKAGTDSKEYRFKQITGNPKDIRKTIGKDIGVEVEFNFVKDKKYSNVVDVFDLSSGYEEEEFEEEEEDDDDDIYDDDYDY